MLAWMKFYEGRANQYLKARLTVAILTVSSFWNRTEYPEPVDASGTCCETPLDHGAKPIGKFQHAWDEHLVGIGTKSPFLMG